MSWTNPANHIYATGEVVTASTMNTYIEANLAFLGNQASAAVATQQGTASNSYTDLATVGPSVTITTMTTAIVFVSATMQNPAGQNVYMGFAVSGASSIAASDANAASIGVAGSTITARFSMVVSLTGLTPGSNILTAKYRTDGATSANWSGRNLAVIPLTV